MAKKAKEKIEKIAKPKAIGPYDIIGMIFTDIAKFNTLSKSILAKNYFMVNRVFAIQYPLQAQCFNNQSVDPALVIRSWASFANRNLPYGRIPSFVFTKGSKKAADAETIKNICTKEEREAYCEYFNISFRDFDDMNEFVPTNLEEHIRYYFDNIDPTKQISKSKK